MGKRDQLKIGNEADRITVAAILIKNGYSVRTAKVIQPNRKTNKIVLEYWVEPEEK